MMIFKKHHVSILFFIMILMTCKVSFATCYAYTMSHENYTTFQSQAQYVIKSIVLNANGTYTASVYPGGGTIITVTNGLKNVTISLYYNTTGSYNLWHTFSLASVTAEFMTGLNSFARKSSGVPTGACAVPCPARSPGGFFPHYPGTYYNDLVVPGDTAMNPDCIVPGCTVYEVMSAQGWCAIKTCPYPEQVVDDQGNCGDPQCISPNELYNHACVPGCQGDQTRNQETGECETHCDPVTQEDINGHCVPKCAENQKRDESGVCKDQCTDVVNEAKARCSAGYTVDWSTCTYHCKSCETFEADCSNSCASHGGVLENYCSSTGSACQCKDNTKISDSFDDQRPYETGTKTGTTEVDNPDGTKDVTETTTKVDADGTKTVTTSTQHYNADGTASGSPVVTTKITKGTDAGGVDGDTDGDGFADTGPSSPDGTGDGLNYDGLKGLKDMVAAKMPSSLLNGTGAAYSSFLGSSTAPVFNFAIGDWTWQADLSVFDPVALFIRSLFKVLLWCGTIWLVYDLWRRWG
jgi:hypothetical protein